MITDERISGWSSAGQLPYRQEAVVLQHLALVQEVAASVQWTLPHPVDGNDLEQAGVVGLLHALGTYDPSKHSVFAAYARSYILATMLDTVRQMDGARRPLAARSNHPGVIDPSLAPYSHGRARRFDRRWEPVDSDEIRPDSICERNELSQSLTRAVRGLPRRYQQVVVLYYVQDMSTRQISAALGVSCSRVSQIRQKALLRVSAALQLVGYTPHGHVRMGLARRRPGLQAHRRPCIS